MDISRIQIDRNVPVPVKKKRAASPLINIISRMKINDSIWLLEREDSVAIYNAICRHFAGSQSAKIAKVTKEDKRGEGYRVWRIK